MRYAQNGSLGDYITKNFKDLKWKDKIEILYRIISGLNNIHQEQLVHHDFHSGNILHFPLLPQKVMIADLGLSVPTDQEPSSIIGVLPYISPEVLNGKPYTIASDIYSFGVLMSVISTGQQPFYNIAHDRDLAFKICEGVRPDFSINTPKFYIELAYKCMDADPDNRPTAEEIYEIIGSLYDLLNHSLEATIFEEFEEMDKIKFDPSTITATVHPNAVYTSRLLKFTNLPQPVNSNKVTIIGNNNGNYQFINY
jgi:serine/threonine protein kinase